MDKMKSVFVIFTLVCSSEKSLAVFEKPPDFSFASYYESNMVLQGYPARAVIWGYAPKGDIGSIVYLNVTNLSQVLHYKTPVKEGPEKTFAVWQFTLDPVRSDDPFNITAMLKSYMGLQLENVLFGDVWFCSGQSNMKFPISQIINSSQEAQEAAKFGKIRFFSVAQVQSVTPLTDISAIEIHWSVPNQGNIKPFSAVCWLFAKYIYQQRPRPMGLVESSWGGTEIEAWSSPDCLKSCGIKRQRHAVFNFSSVKLQYTTDVDGTDKVHVKDITENTLGLEKGFDSKLYFRANRPLKFRKNLVHSSLWNAMVHPLLNMTIFGALWYQGEANAYYNTNRYKCMLPTMIHDWRQKWYDGTVGQTDLLFPVGIVQLGPTSGPEAIAGFADIRWHQTVDVGYLPNKMMQRTFMAAAYDLADPVGGIHFRDKLTLSRRLALSGMAIAYGQTGQKYLGPWVTQYTLDVANYLLMLKYDKGKSPIVARNEKGFEVCCQLNSTNMCSFSGNDWLPAPLVSWNNNSIFLSIKTCAQKYMTGIRFVWRETPCAYRQAPVYSVENNLPAPPFILQQLFGLVSAQKE